VLSEFIKASALSYVGSTKAHGIFCHKLNITNARTTIALIITHIIASLITRKLTLRMPQIILLKNLILQIRNIILKTRTNLSNQNSHIILKPLKLQTKDQTPAPPNPPSFCNDETSAFNIVFSFSSEPFSIRRSKT
jgi:hypothetical protein